MYYTTPTAEIEVEDLFVEFTNNPSESRPLTRLFKSGDHFSTQWRYEGINKNGATLYHPTEWYAWNGDGEWAEAQLMTALSHPSGFILLEDWLVKITDISVAKITRIKRKVTVKAPAPQPERSRP